MIRPLSVLLCAVLWGVTGIVWAQGDLQGGPIQPGDLLFVEVYRVPEMTSSYQVNAQGELTLPYVGPVGVRGMTPTEASDAISRALTEILRNPRVKVMKSAAQLNQYARGRPQDMRMEIMPLENASAENVALSLQGLSSTQGSVGYDPDTNSLIVTDSPSVIDSVRDAVYRLDRMQSQLTQVRIETRIAEVQDGAMKELGIKWFAQGDHVAGGFVPTPRRTTGLNSLRGGLSPLANELIGTDDSIFGTSLSREFVGGDESFDRRLQIPVNVPVAGQTFFGFSNSGIDLGTLLDMLVSDDKAKVLANPMILTVNHKTAEIRMVEEFPYTEFGTEITGATNFSVKFLDLGIILEVTPHVYQDTYGQYVKLDLRPEVSFPSGSSNGVPIRSVRSSQSVASVRDGQTLVVGGIISEDERTIDTRLPGLGDLPIIGNLFRHKEDSRTRTELMIFVTPTIHERPEEITWDKMIDVAEELQASSAIPTGEMTRERRRD